MQKNDKNMHTSAEQKLSDMQRTKEYPVIDRKTLKDFDALSVKMWVEEHELWWQGCSVPMQKAFLKTPSKKAQFYCALIYFFIKFLSAVNVLSLGSL